MSESRMLPVPDAFVGGCVDAASSRILGMSRVQRQALVEAGNILVSGGVPSKSTRLAAMDLLEVTIPALQTPPVPATRTDIPYDDKDIIVVDKLVGVTAHTDPGWNEPTVLGNLEAAGCRITGYGPPERQGIVHRLDVGISSAVMVVGSELAYSVMKRAFKERTMMKIYHTVVVGYMDSPSGTTEAPIGHRPSRE